MYTKDSKFSPWFSTVWQSVVSLLTKNEKYPREVHWEGALARYILTSDMELKREYAIPFDGDGLPDYTAIELKYMRNNPPEKGRYDENGWMAPDGTFYPCAYGEHFALAERICGAELGFLGDRRDLVKRGWLEFQDGYCLGSHLMHKGKLVPTEAQIVSIAVLIEKTVLTEAQHRRYTRLLELMMEIVNAVEGYDDEDIAHVTFQMEL